MSRDGYRSAPPSRCASCGVATDPADAFLSARGPVCAACHRQDVRTVRDRDQRRAAGTDALINGVFALGAAAMLSVAAFFTPDGMVPGRVFGICGLSIVALVVCALRARRFGIGATYARLGGALVVVGVVLGTISAVTIAQRLGG